MPRNAMGPTKDWADEERPADPGRRRFLRGTLVAGAAGLVGTAVAGAKSIIPSPIEFRGTVENGFRYGRPDNPNVWYAPLSNRPVATTDFRLWQGASVLWRSVLDETGAVVPGSGFPAVIVCVEASLLEAPPEFEPYVVRADVDGVPAAFVAVYARCVHLCCKPGWHQYPVPDAFRNYIVEPRTLLATDSATGAPDPQDPIWCLCHNSQYDPLTLVRDVHPPPANVPYIGARYVQGPATRGVPCIPLRTAGTLLEGIYDPDEGGHPEWYSAYCR